MIKYLLLLLILFLINYSNSLKVIDYTTNSLNQYTDSLCKITFNFLITNRNSLTSEINFNYPFILPTNSNQSYNQLNTLKDNGDFYQKVTIDFKDFDGFGNINFIFYEFENGNKLNDTYISLKFSCSKPPLPDLNNILISDFQYLSNQYMVSYFSIPNWLDKSNLIDLKVNTSNCDTCYMNKDDKIYTVYSGIKDFQEINLNFYSTILNNINFNLKFKGVLKIGNEMKFKELLNIEYYPNESNVIQNSLASYCYSIVKIKTDLEIKNLWSLWSSNNFNSVLYTSRLIESDGFTKSWLTSFSLFKDKYSTSFWDNQKVNVLSSQQVGGGINWSPSYNITYFVPPTSGVKNIELSIMNTVISGTFLTTIYSPTELLESNSLSYQIVYTFGSLNNKKFTSYASFPYGCTSKVSTGLSTLYGSSINVDFIANIGDSNVKVTAPTSVIPPGPDVTHLQFDYIGYNKFSVSMESKNNFYFMTTNNENYDKIIIRSSDFMFGNIITGATYNSIYSPIPGIDFTQNDISKSFAYYDINMGIKSEPELLLNPPIPYIEGIMETPTIESFYFEIPNMNTTNIGGINSAYLSFGNSLNHTSKFLLYYHPSLLFFPYGLSRNLYFDKPIPFYWNHQKNLFQADFYIPANLPTDSSIDYQIINNIGSIYPSSQIKLKFSNSNLNSFSDHGYSLPPIIKSYEFEKNVIEIYNSSTLNNVYFKIVLEDTLNGFDYGFISISSKEVKLKKMYFNFTINSNDASGDNRNEFKVLLNLPCVSIKYEILNITLVDKQGYYSQYSRYTSNRGGINLPVNPLMKFDGPNELESLQVNCNVENEKPFNLPTLKLLKVDVPTDTPLVVNLGYPNPLTFTMQVYDENGIMTDSQLPYIYLTAGLVDGIISAPFRFYRFVNDSQTVEFVSDPINIPYGWGSTHNQILLSVYGIVNKFGVIMGYDYHSLDDFKTSNPSLDIISKIYTKTLDISPSNGMLLSYSPFYGLIGGELTLFGKNLQNFSNVWVLKSRATQYEDPYPVVRHNAGGSIVINLPSGFNSPFLVCLYQNLYQGVIEINPILFNKINQQEIINTTPIPTNPPQKCSGNPICGGPKQGTCIEGVGCLCFSPYTGPSCNSKTIIIRPPIIDPTKPTSNLTLEPTDSNDHKDIMGIVSIISLRELNFESKPIKTFLFDKWILTKLNENENLYSNSIQDSNGKFICNITISTIWFKELTNITFANQPTTMDPSTLKYNINITSYPFESKLNSLELLMSATAISTNDNSYCLSQSFGETVNDNSNYIKIQINQQSIYGKFIKRGIIDFSDIILISNKLKDQKDLSNDEINLAKSTTTNKQDISSNSIIGITIPYYELLAQLDPSFSLLIDTEIDENENTICNNKSNNKISTKIIIAIVVSIVGFSIILVISIIIIIKKKYYIRHFKDKVIKLKKSKNQN